MESLRTVLQQVQRAAAARAALTEAAAQLRG